LSDILPEELSDVVTSRLAIAAFRALLATSGPERTLRALTPYTKHCGMAIACNARKRLGIQGHGLEEVALPLYWMDTGIAGRDISALEIHEDGAVMEVRDCPLKDAPPELCVALSHRMGEGICEVVNPDYEYFYTHHLTDGDPFCRIVVKKRSIGGNADNLGAVTKVIPSLDLPDAEVRFLRSQGIAETLFMTTKGFVDIHGPDLALEIVRPYATETGRSLASTFIEHLESEGNADPTTEEVIESVCAALGQKRSVVATNDNETSFECVECPLKDAPREVCRQFEMAMNGVCEEMGHGREFVYSSMMSKKDSVCRSSIRKKPKSPAAGLKEQTTQEDPMRVLALRYAKGEITEEELEAKVEKLRKLGIVR
jgi:hypothetical protein